VLKHVSFPYIHASRIAHFRILRLPGKLDQVPLWLENATVSIAWNTASASRGGVSRRYTENFRA
jgi:hypothetical protein